MKSLYIIPYFFYSFIFTSLIRSLESSSSVSNSQLSKKKRNVLGFAGNTFINSFCFLVCLMWTSKVVREGSEEFIGDNLINSIPKSLFFSFTSIPFLSYPSFVSLSLLLSVHLFFLVYLLHSTFDDFTPSHRFTHQPTPDSPIFLNLNPC